MELRNLRFSSETAPRHWLGGRKAVTSFLDNLSIFFPHGERFFVQAVHAHRALVTDETLKAQVRIFAGQEGFHSREHQRLNAHLAEHGYPAVEMERRVERLLALVQKRLPRRWQLAATCALEHLTALMAHMLLAHPKIFEGADPTMAALWRWHAAEENEHKSVAFDVYLAAKGPYLERVGIMALASVIFWAKVLEQQVRFMRHDRIALSWREWRALARFLFVEPGAMLGLVPLYLAYYKPGFHPSQLPSEHIVEAWKQAQAQAAGMEAA